jgi:hypothetical protein
MNRGFQYQLVLKTRNYLNQLNVVDLNAFLCKSNTSTSTMVLVSYTRTD